MEVFQSYLCSGSDHVREKDGVWAALCWLQVGLGQWPSPYLFPPTPYTYILPQVFAELLSLFPDFGCKEMLC